MDIEILLAAIVAGVTSAVVANLSVPVARRLAISLRAVDQPGGRRQHVGAVPRTGGIAILAGTAVGVTSAGLGFRLPGDPAAPAEPVLALAVGTLMVFLVGLVDDLIGVSIAKRLLVETVAAWLIVSAGWSFSNFGLPLVGDLRLGMMGPLMSILWIVGVANAVNLFDGLDGLAAGVVAIIAASMTIYGLLQGSSFVVLVLGGVLGSCLGFLRHNWSPARIFLGDSGALTLGFLLAAMSVRSSLKASAAVAILVPVLALGVPVIDTLFVMLLRLLERPGPGAAGRVARVFHADRLHLHHLLEPLSPRRSRIVRWIYLMVVVSCTMALVVAVTKNGRLGWILVSVELAVIAAVRQLGMSRRVRELRLRAVETHPGEEGDLPPVRRAG